MKKGFSVFGTTGSMSYATDIIATDSSAAVAYAREHYHFIEIFSVTPLSTAYVNIYRSTIPEAA